MLTVAFYSVLALSSAFLAATLVNHMILSWKKYNDKKKKKGFNIDEVTIADFDLPVVTNVSKIKRKNPSCANFGNAYIVDLRCGNSVEPFIAYYWADADSKPQLFAKRAIDFSDVLDHTYDMVYNAVEKHSFKESFEFDDSLEVKNAGFIPYSSW